MSDSKKKPNIPPPDDFSKTTPNINLSDEDTSGWDNTRFDSPVETPADDWGKTVINYDVSSLDDKQESDDSRYSNNSPKQPDWGMTQANVNLNSDFEETDETDIGEAAQYGATVPYFKLPEAEREKYQKIPPTPSEKIEKAAKEKLEKGGVPTWFWITAGLMAMFAFSVVVLLGAWYIFSINKGFDVIVKGAPAGSKFYVDESEWGVPSTRNEHRLFGLESGTRQIKVVHPKFKCDVKDVSGVDGKSLTFIPRCEPTNRVAISDVDCEKTLNEQTRESCAEEILDGLSNPPDLDRLLRALNLLRINFATGSANVPERNKRILTKAATHVKNLPKSVVIEIGGHTDNVGTDSNNHKLSERRAKAVRNIIISFGVGETRLTNKGYGEVKPTADNKTSIGKARNRRIEYSVVKR